MSSTRLHAIFVILAMQVLGICSVVSAQGIQTIPQILQTAVTSGKANGQVTGDIATMFQQQFKTAQPVLARANVIKSFKRKDCKRVSLVIEVPGVFMTDTQGKKLDARVNTELNLCADGQPPSSEEM